MILQIENNNDVSCAERRGNSKIAEEDANRALEELKISLTRRIEKSDYGFLENIYQGSRE